MSAPECDRCGLCCERLIVEIRHVDVVREPRLLEHAEPLKGFNDEIPEDPREREYLLAPVGDRLGCALHLGPGLGCAIHPTRPTCCVSFEAGSAHCQRLRFEARLPPLGLDAWPDGDELELLLYPEEGDEW